MTALRQHGHAAGYSINRRRCNLAQPHSILQCFHVFPRHCLAVLLFSRLRLHGRLLLLSLRDFSPHSNDGIWVTILCSSLPDAYYALASPNQSWAKEKQQNIMKRGPHMMCRYRFTAECSDLGRVWFGGVAGISISNSKPEKYACKPETFQYFKVVVAVVVIVGRFCLFVPLYYVHRWHALKYFVL